LGSGQCPAEPTEEIRNSLSLFAVRREDFKNYCEVKGYELPKFWFPENVSIEKANEETVDEYILRRENEGAAKKELAVELHDSFNLSIPTHWATARP